MATVQKLCLGLVLMVITKEQFQLGVRFGMEIDHKHMYSHLTYEIL